MKTYLTILFTSTLACVVSPLVGQPYTWTGGGGEFANNFTNSPNWDVMPNWSFGEYRDFIFSESTSGYYGPINQDVTGNVWIKSLTFDESVGGSYNLTYEPVYLEAGSVIRNLSRYEQRIESAIVFAEWTNHYHIYSGNAGVVLAGGSSKIGGFNTTVHKYDMGALTLAGEHRINTLLLRQGSLILDGNDTVMGNLALTVPTTLSFWGAGEDGFQGGNEFVLLGNSGNQTTDLTMSFGASANDALRTYGSARIRLDSQGGDGTSLTFTNWQYNYFDDHTYSTRYTLNFDLIGNSNVHVDAFSHPNRFLGVDNVAYWATVSTSNETNGSKTTGFMQLVGDAINGYDVTRYEGYTALPSNQSALAPDGANYYVNGSHTMAGTAPGSPGQAGLKTLTIMGSGTLQVDNNFHIQNILLQEGSGDYTIYLPTSQITHDVWGAQGRAALTLHQYRTTGDLIIDANLHSAQLITTGPGKSIIRSASAHSLLTELLVQEGRLQLESNALSTVTVANIYAGNLGGSGQVGTSNTVLNVYHGGTLDATPTAHITESGLRGLQIYGSVIMDKDAALAMTLTSDVLSGNYNALRVTASNPLNTVVNLDGDLQVTLQDHFSGERWIVLLETNGLIDGSFASVNGEAFGLGNHFVLSYGGADYDFYLHYDHDLGGGMTALALQAIPEPSTITLLLGVIMSGVLWLRRSRKKTVE